MKGTDPGRLANYMERFRQWKVARDQLIAQGMFKKAAGVRASIEGRSPTRQFRETLNSSAAEANTPGYYDLRKMGEKFEKEGLTPGDVSKILGTLTNSHVNVLRTTIYMRREILKRLEKRGVKIDGSSLNFSLEDPKGLIPQPAQLPVVPSDRSEVAQLLSLYQQLEEQATQVANHAMSVSHQLHQQAAQRLDELAKGAVASHDEALAMKLRDMAKEITRQESDIFGQFIFGYGRRMDVEGVAGPVEQLLSERQKALSAAGWPKIEASPNLLLEKPKK